MPHSATFLLPRITVPTRFFRRLLLTLAAFALCADLLASPLKNDEEVLFVPGTARIADDGMVHADVHAWVYELERRPGLSSALALYLGIDLDALSPQQHARFYQRTQLFRVDSERGKTLRIRFADGIPHSLEETDAGGRSHTRLSLTPAAFQANAQGRAAFALLRPKPRSTQENGEIWLVPSQGVSVVSDIDDTVKDSQVLDQKQLLRNTFLEEFKAVPGMAAWYRSISGQHDQVSFHYLSSSPIQLYPLLKDFLATAGFPGGSMHLRESTRWRNVIPGSGASQAHKRQTLQRLLHDFPERHFILIGDSGEADPEIYADMARAHPARILAIHIRDVTGEAADAPRYRRTFSGIAPEKWQVFQHPPQSDPVSP